MAGNRRGAEAYILEKIGLIDPSGTNTKIYQDLFAGMNDKQFEAFIVKLESGEEILPLISPNLGKNPIDVGRNIKIAEGMGKSFFQRILIDMGDGSRPYLTPEKYFTSLQVMRRQAQLLIKKASIPQDNKSINDLTGQPSATGKSRGSKLSYPETQIMAALALDNSLIEGIKYRGGDTKGFIAMNQSIAQTGGVSLRSLDTLNTRVKSTDTLKTILTAMHFEVDV